MTQLEQLKALTAESGIEPNETLLNVYLDMAQDIIMSHRYPSGDRPDEMETQFLGLQVRIAEALYDKRGNEGQTAGSENGISRTYGTDGVPLSLLREITPIAKIVS